MDIEHAQSRVGLHAVPEITMRLHHELSFGIELNGGGKRVFWQRRGFEQRQQTTLEYFRRLRHPKMEENASKQVCGRDVHIFGRGQPR